MDLAPAASRLPEGFWNVSERETLDRIVDELIACPPARPWDEPSVISRWPGLYLYSEADGRHVFVGQSRTNIRRQVRQHSAITLPSRQSIPAAFAVQLARHKCPEFMELVIGEMARAREMDVRWLEIDDPKLRKAVVQHAAQVLRPYANPPADTAEPPNTSAPGAGDESVKAPRRTARPRNDSPPITLIPIPDQKPCPDLRPRRRNCRLDVSVTPELRDRLLEATEGVQDSADNWWDRLDAGAVVREVLRSALGMPTTDQGRTLERLAAWRRQVGVAESPAQGEDE